MSLYTYMALSCFYLRPTLILSSDLPPLPPSVFQEVAFLQVSTPKSCTMHFSAPCHTPSPSRPWLARPVNISWEELTMMFFYKTISWILLVFPISYTQISSTACYYYPMLLAIFFTRYDVPIFTPIQSSRQFMALHTSIFMFLWLQKHFFLIFSFKLIH